jgi:hypothetical protein
MTAATDRALRAPYAADQFTNRSVASSSYYNILTI